MLLLMIFLHILTSSLNKPGSVGSQKGHWREHNWGKMMEVTNSL